MNDLYSFAGIDVGSRSIELVVFNGASEARQVKALTTFDPLAQCEKAHGWGEGETDCGHGI
jgi:hypothetical protein